jgi:signal transduction histidine kinase
MSALPPSTRRPLKEAAAAHADALGGAESGFDTESWEQSLGRPLRPARWMGWRLRALVLVALLGSVALISIVRLLANEPMLDAQWRVGSQGRLELTHSPDPALRGFEGRVLQGLREPGGGLVEIDALLLHRSLRWLVGDADRERHARQHLALAEARSQGQVQLIFSGGASVEPALVSRGALGLGAVFWLSSGLALVLYLVAAMVLLLRPTTRNGLYALMSLCQAGNLLFIAAESIPGLGLPAGLLPWDHATLAGLDLVTAAAIVQVTAPGARKATGRPSLTLGVWLPVATLVGLTFSGHLTHSWWWTQLGAIAMGLLAIAQLGWSRGLAPQPAAVVLRRFGIVAVGTLVLLTVAIAAADRLPGPPHAIAGAGSIGWTVFLASLLLLLPFLSRSPPLMREFSMLAGVSTIAISLDLLFVAVFSLGQFAAVTLSLGLSLAIYAGVRQWILSQMIGTNLLSTERMFEQLYRIAREVEAKPEKASERLAGLLRELFEPLEVIHVERTSNRSRIVAEGSTLLVPVPRLAGAPNLATASIVLRFAHRGKRLFTAEDARLSDRVVEQLRRAVAYDRAVEQGRREERVRIAQDLHDDIGARLLTLMYKAASPEVEDYVRHTLQDLKTLTRGLAASNHQLSHAAAEWKADLTQRLTAADCVLGWSFSVEHDVPLTVVQWSALTRVLRELISNAIAHAHASRVDIDAVCEDGRLVLSVSDNGVGRDPKGWAHGLGLGGVRKRVKQLGGTVVWRENGTQGICCEVVIPDLGDGL